MTTQTIVDSKTQSQAPQVWDKLTALAQIGDYFHVPFTPVMQVVDRDTLEDGQVWLLLKPSTGSSYTEEWILKPEQPVGTQQQPEQEPQPVGFAGDSVAYQLQPTEEAHTEFSQGRTHGQQDAAAKLHPMYTQPESEYAAGYVSGYDSELSPSPQEEVIEPPTWSIQYDPNWDWYRVWVGDSCIGHGTDYQQAERIAQRYIAAKEFWQQHRQVVVAAYADKT